MRKSVCGAFLKLAVCFLCFNSAAFSADEPPKSNILFILVDTLRADHLGCYGYKKDVSPRIDMVAREGVLFTNFYSTCPWTNPAVVSMFTGLYPHAVFSPRPFVEAVQQKIPQELTMMAEILRDNGYFTFAYVDNALIRPELNYYQGFADYIYKYKFADQRLEGSDPREVSEAVLSRFERHKSGIFVYLHLVYPHLPYVSHSRGAQKDGFGEGFQELDIRRKGEITEMYDGEVRFTDDLIGEIFSGLKRYGLLENTYIVITSDHGEGFFEHGKWDHGYGLYDELLKVPLIIYPPSGIKDRGRKVDELSASIDIFPTIMDFAGIKKFPRVEGESLSGLIFQLSRLKRKRIIFGESPHVPGAVNSISSRDERYKFIYNPPREIKDNGAAKKDINSFRFCEAYDTINDPGERQNIAVRGPRCGQLKSLGLRLIGKKISDDRNRARLGQGTAGINDDLMDKFRSLGYVQ